MEKHRATQILILSFIILTIVMIAIAPIIVGLTYTVYFDGCVNLSTGEHCTEAYREEFARKNGWDYCVDSGGWLECYDTLPLNKPLSRR